MEKFSPHQIGMFAVFKERKFLAERESGRAANAVSAGPGMTS